MESGLIYERVFDILVSFPSGDSVIYLIKPN